MPYIKINIVWVVEEHLNMLLTKKGILWLFIGKSSINISAYHNNENEIFPSLHSPK